MLKAFLLALVFLSLSVLAQVPVTNSGAGNSSIRNQSTSSQAVPNNDLVISLYEQLETLQQEVQSLRGIVEEQNFQIKKIQTEQRDRYLDIDRRLSISSQNGVDVATSEVSRTSPASLLSTTGQAEVSTADSSTQRSTSAVGEVVQANNPTQRTRSEAVPVFVQPAGAPLPALVGQMDEQELYRTSLNLLLEQSNYEESISMFQSYIDNYPQGRYLTNSYYWQGEAFILVSRFSQAKDVFNKILSEYSQDPKAAGAMLKLGVAYKQLGDLSLADQTWREIATRYPDSSTEIREAENYLNGQ